jgi:hypothetical protein
MTRRLAVAALAFAATAGSLCVDELLTRMLDGYQLTSLRLERRPELRPRDITGIHAATKLERDDDAVAYVNLLPVAAGVDRRWFVSPIPSPTRRPADPDLDARARRYPDAGLPANYEWNRAAVIDGVCRGQLRNLISFGRFSDIFVFDAAGGSVWPTFRFLRRANYPSGLTTNAFGWRGTEVALNKPPRTIRIAFVGASTTVGPHAEPYSYPEIAGFWLNTWARARGLDLSIEVVNAGREALTSRSFQAIVRQELAPIEPDLLVYYEGSNQFWPADFLTSPVPRRSRLMGVAQRGAERYSALASRAIYLVRKSTESGLEPPKPRLAINWPRDLDEYDPSLDDPRLPVNLPTILTDLDAIRHTADEIGGRLVMTSFVWLVYPGMVLDPARDATLYAYLNTTFWPFSYAHMRRFADFQSLVFQKYAASKGLDFIDLAASYPRDPRLFDDSIHMTHAGIRLQAWIVFNGLVPILERGVVAREWPRPMRHPLAVHPAFADRRLVPMRDVTASCSSAYPAAAIR